ncbi:MAG: hypothetical protein LBR93_09680, partial [Treponema sp.]|nr:hypothetical protein [Treponema sp.]
METARRLFSLPRRQIESGAHPCRQVQREQDISPRVEPFFTFNAFCGSFYFDNVFSPWVSFFCQLNYTTKRERRGLFFTCWVNPILS